MLPNVVSLPGESPLAGVGDYSEWRNGADGGTLQRIIEWSGWGDFGFTIYDFGLE